jgi:hypothetical protein
MTLNYDPTIMLIVYSRTYPGSTSVTESDLADFDKEWFNDRDDDLVRIMTEKELTIDARSKAMVIALQLDMQGGIFGARVRHACDLFKSAPLAA